MKGKEGTEGEAVREVVGGLLAANSVGGRRLSERLPVVVGMVFHRQEGQEISDKPAYSDADWAGDGLLIVLPSCTMSTAVLPWHLPSCPRRLPTAIRTAP